MKRKAMGVMGGLLAMALVLSACTDQASSAPESVPEAQTPQATAVTVPQTTASPQEQTGFGYRTEIGTLSIADGQAENMFVLKDTVYLDVMENSGVHGLYTLENGQKVSAPELGGDIAAMAPDGERVWYCVRSGGLRLVCAAPGEETVQQEVTLDGTENVLPLGMAVGGDGCFYLMLSDSVQIFNPKGKRVSSLPLSDGQFGVNILSLENGQVLLNAWTLQENGTRLGSVALLSTESIGASLTDKSVAYTVYGGWGSTVLLSGGGNLYTLDTESGEMNALLSWVDSGVNPNGISAAAAVSAERIEVVTGNESGQQRLTLSQVPVSELEEKTTLNVGLGGIGTELQNAITALTVDFNRESEDFRIHLVDYSVYSDGDARLSADVGDLDLVIGPESVLEGAELADLTALFDDAVGEDALTDGVLSALQRQGAVESLPLYVTVKTLVGSAAVLGAQEGWSASEFLATVQAHPDTAILQLCNAYDTLDALLATAGGAVTDYASLLAAASLIPVEDQALYELEANLSQSVYQCLKDKTLLAEEVELTDFMGLKALEAAIGEDLVLKGYPADSGNGAVLSMPVRLGISKSSEHPDEVWAFLKEILSGSATVLSQQSVGFPVLKTDFEAMAQEAAQGVRYQAENGEMVEENPVVWVDGEAREVQPFTQEEIDQFAAYCAGNSGIAGGSDALRDSARSALKQVLEAGTAPEAAAKDITE